MEVIRKYIEQVNKAYGRGDATEHTYRPALKELMQSIDSKVTATNEPKRIACGAPDYCVSKKLRTISQTVGYIEAKDIGSNLNQIAKSERVKSR